MSHVLSTKVEREEPKPPAIVSVTIELTEQGARALSAVAYGVCGPFKRSTSLNTEAYLSINLYPERWDGTATALLDVLRDIGQKVELALNRPA